MSRGHEQVYYQLDTVNPEKPVTCRYSGLRFMKRKKTEGGH